MCISSGLRIANGHAFEDTQGKFTCHTCNGSSLVDYRLVESTTLSQIRYLIVEPLIGDISDHCKVSFGTALCVKRHKTKSSKTNPIPSRFIWLDKAEVQLKN